MIDAEVVQLRKLRKMALRVRALAEGVGAQRSPQQGAVAMSALLSWSVARVVTGRLRGHPNLSCQKGPNRIRNMLNRAVAFLGGATDQYRGRALRAYATELHHLAREMADMRALTWDQDWSDTLGRAQGRLQGLMQQLPAVPSRSIWLAERRIDASSRPGANGRQLSDVGICNEWPYLAF